MASERTEIQRIAERYADLVALQRQLVPPFIHQALPLLKASCLRLPLPKDAAGIAAQLRIAKGLADKTPAETKIRAIWMALLGTHAPLASMDECDQARAAFTGRYGVMPIQSLLGGLSPSENAALPAILRDDAKRYECGDLASYYLERIFAPTEAAHTAPAIQAGRRRRDTMPASG